LNELSLSEEQQGAREQIAEWLNQPRSRWKYRQVFRLFGYAGTGKTTLARQIADEHPGGVYAAYTGKAALVLGQSLGREASTIHSLIYRPDPCDGPLYDEPVCPHGKTGPHMEWTDGLDSPLRTARYLILDECSMVNRKIAMDLLWYGKPILVLGDPAQLPPIRDGQDADEGLGYFTDAEPDVMLTEVHRHRDDGGILELATAVRQGHGINAKPQVIRDHLPAVLDERMPDVVITGMNKTRLAANHLCRERMGHTDALPQPGEPLLCLQNNRKLGLFNGQVVHVVTVKWASGRHYAVRVKDPYTGQVYPWLTALHRDLVRSDLTGLTQIETHARFAYGYAITTHKSQGSQWDNVVVVDEWRSGGIYNNWLYTAVTRAVENVRVIRKPYLPELENEFEPTPEELELVRARTAWPL
jgi:exodeoxyribonuclease-5